MVESKDPDSGLVPADDREAIDAETAALMREVLASVGAVEEPAEETVLEPVPLGEPIAELEPVEERPAEPEPVSTPVPMTELAATPPVLEDSEPEGVFVAAPAPEPDDPVIRASVAAPLPVSEFGHGQTAPRTVVFPDAPVSSIEEAVDFEQAAMRNWRVFPSLPLALLVVLGVVLGALTYLGISRETLGAGTFGVDVYTYSLYALSAIGVLCLVLIFPLWSVAKRRYPASENVFLKVLARMLFIAAICAAMWFAAVAFGRTSPMALL